MPYYYLKSRESQEALRNYKYSGSDESYIYKYVLSPLAAYLVDTIIPSTMAPNTVTMIGFSFMILTYVLSIIYCPTYDTEAPSWLYIFFGVSILFYQTLDNMDGKQARKTGTSSAMGLLFDHGCDAINVAFGVHIVASAFLCDSNLLLSLIFLAPSLPFFIGTWEQYFTHYLLLPEINGPTEGLIGLACICFVSGVAGPSFWKLTTFYDALVKVAPVIGTYIPSCENRLLMMGLTTSASIREVFGKLVYVSRKFGASTLFSTLPYWSFFVSTFVIVTHKPDLFESNHGMFVNLCSAIFFDMTAQIMFDHITSQTYSGFRWIILPLMYLAYACKFNTMEDSQLYTFMVAYCSSLTTFLLLKSAIIINEIGSCLKIWCFDITTPYDDEGSVSPVVNGSKKIN